MTIDTLPSLVFCVRVIYQRLMRAILPYLGADNGRTFGARYTPSPECGTQMFSCVHICHARRPYEAVDKVVGNKHNISCHLAMLLESSRGPQKIDMSRKRRHECLVQIIWEAMENHLWRNCCSKISVFTKNLKCIYAICKKGI